MFKKDIQDIKIPDLNLDAIKGEGLSKERAWEIAHQHVEFLIHYQMLSRTGLMKKGASEEARKAEKNLEKLRENYEGFHRFIQKALAEKMKEVAIQDGDSKTLFNRLTVLASEALFHGSVAEWTEESFARARGSFEEKRNLKKCFWVRIRLSANEFVCLLPYTWGNRTHKSIALILKDLEEKARNTWKKENGIEPRKREAPVEKPETAPEPEEVEPKPKKEKPVKKTTVEKTNKKKVVKQKGPEEKKAAAQKKKVVEKEIKQESEVDIKQARGKSLTDFSELESLKK